jgi:hypothetical protein
MINSKSSPFEIINRFFDLTAKHPNRTDVFEKFFGSVGNRPNYKLAIRADHHNDTKYSRTNYYFQILTPFNNVILNRVLFIDGYTIICGAVNGTPFSMQSGEMFFGETDIAASGAVIDVTKYMEMDESIRTKAEAEA